MSEATGPAWIVLELVSGEGRGYIHLFEIPCDCRASWSERWRVRATGPASDREGLVAACVAAGIAPP